MRKMEYLDALKRAMMGLPPETQAKTLAYYEQRFVDGIAAGRSEEEVGADLDDPAKIAMTLRASAHLNTFNERKQPVNVLRMLLTAAGLAIFNLFMLVPAAVLGALLVSVYVAAGAFYGSGIVVTASGLAGANEFVFNEPLRLIALDRNKITVVDRKHPDGATATIRIGPRGIEVQEDIDNTPVDTGADSASIIEEDARNGSIHVITDMDASSRGTQVAVGAGLVLGGIILTLIALVVTRFSLIGLKRYLQMNLSLLKGS
ncbi:hypothetical protein GCM10027321_02650 [Massilia terrae]|uniref:DUF1700 domain-containing protein n=1 Tax=Massilia terrae TaxID=1811224 RepID=A0ABT2CTS3_9BURK|nr:DUF1700 domain-containing protein [Massilia terrae]MCS0657371.1 DUF1700 domain-containing protein [Massilia terrae]